MKPEIILKQPILDNINFDEYNNLLKETFKDAVCYSVNEIENIQNKEGIYFFFTKEKDLLYIGKSNNIKSRIMQHMQSLSVFAFIHTIKIKYISFDTKDSSKIANLLGVIEKNFINSLYPIFNGEGVKYQSQYYKLNNNNYNLSERMSLAEKLILEWREITKINYDFKNVSCSFKVVKSNEGDDKRMTLGLEDIASYLNEKQKYLLSMKQITKYIENSNEIDINKNFVIEYVNKIIKNIETDIFAIK